MPWILAEAHAKLVFPKMNEFYSVSYSNFENSQTRCFSIILLSIGLIFIEKHDIDYLYIQTIFYIFLIFMFFDITIYYGLIGLPRSTIHWFIEFVNRYIFGFSGTSTITDCFIQLLRGSLSIAFCCVVLYFKNLFWSRMICLFFSSFVTSFEINKKVVIFSLIRSVVGSIFFIIFNYFLASESSSNIIEIVFIIYYAIFEFIIPYISSISCYLFIYAQIIKNNKILNYIRLLVSLISAPIIIGSLLSNDVHFVISSLIIIHSINRSFSEPQVFGVALIISRFALYYDFDFTSNVALNFLIGLFISRKFFSIIDILYMRLKHSMEFLDTEISLMKYWLDIEIDLSDYPPIMQIIIYYLKGAMFTPSYCFYIPSFFWSLITGSPINFLFMLHSFPQPYPPKSNLFWDYTAEKYSSNEHIIESFVYNSFVNSFKEKLYNLVKKGVLGIVDENSFFIFHQDRCLILCHIISINSFSIDFQIRCTEFTQNTLCHSGELSIFTNISNQDLSRLDMEDSLQFIKSIYSPVASHVDFYGYTFYPIDLLNAYVSLSPKQKSIWITYSLCFCFIKQNESGNHLLNLVNEGKYFLINDIKSKLDDIKNHKKIPNLKIDDDYDYDYDDDDDDDEDDDSLSISEISYSNSHHFNEEIYEQFNFNSQIIHDFLYDSYAIINFLMKNPTRFFSDYLLKYNKTGVESFLNNAGMRSCLYMFLASSYLTPETDDFEEVKNFLDQTEEEYEISSISDLKKILLEFRYDKNDAQDKYGNKSFFSITGKKEDYQLAFIRKSKSHWNVFKIERDFLRSIWASQCCEIFGFENLDDERLSLQEDVYHLNNLMNQISDVPMSYPAYVSNIEKSYLSINDLK